jgi:hypothetical protein
MSALIASSLGHNFLGFAVLAFRLCAKAPKEMIAITDRQRHTLGSGLLILRTLYGRVRYPLCAGCRCRPMQPMGGRQLAPKGMRCNGTGRLYGGDVEILYGPDIAGDAF